MSNRSILALTWLCLFSFSTQAQTNTPAHSCNKTVYLTFDTGNMSVAQTVADILKRHNIKATFFLANEKTFRGDYALEDSWKPFWRMMQQEGHHFGSHTYNHDYFVKDGPRNEVFIKPQFGPQAGKTMLMSEASFCKDIREVDQRFVGLTGESIQKIWRAPGGKTSPRLISMGNLCGYQHIAWAPSGFLGDELNSDKHPNAMLLEKASQGIRDGDITMAHLGIWSRKDPWAPAVLESLILNLKKRGFCFATLPTNSPNQSK
ncbi:polysaccharide deacetylase family protein [Polynucleobacter paneuropaeus]|uniref:Polysaccharide deacetylase family protein n=1 Tax=Polynucleobacter paneuropaeus TaxID=2527775 RepID=A0AAE2YJK6_9BURK|nr:polysaccharide deacetylase family protein [Polynucleobacter paneuropaeus]MBT8538535.1 polysaccharide deacetylase family protein [Polynucleobacter paneuropaeus]MBT8589967.1 polysaccharide deacetylase family protein [Polynucleobacter paneuropaeus]MBT8590662.1 polysaccharide deacetylase family protein [Polynucleobacter paneuropaeus]MBT8596039.1 polysaccharide deacetylase family protein [Polynucleobacter paneuropaeus]MBT8597865.1 polysaccharide deacetylase family protein [Polynucleobacter paneu